VALPIIPLQHCQDELSLWLHPVSFIASTSGQDRRLTEHHLSRRRACAALVSPNGHIRIRCQPDLADSFLHSSNWKGMTMRSLTASVIVAALSLGTPAFVQAQGASSQPGAESSSDQSKTVIRSIQIVDVKELQPAVRAKVDEIVAQTSDQDIQSLRKSIDATPQAASLLKAKGLNSSQVVAINIADGVLTMFTKTA
jgi:hypothetical protein